MTTRFGARLGGLTLLLMAAIGTITAQPDTRAAVANWVTANQKPVIAELLELLAIPNVAADAANIRRNADHLHGMLQMRGFTTEVLESDGNPLVHGELRVPGATRTLLLYCHYDGQPVAPAQWAQPDPFDPVLRTGRLEEGARTIDVASVERLRCC